MSDPGIAPVNAVHRHSGSEHAVVVGVGEEASKHEAGRIT